MFVHGCCVWCCRPWTTFLPLAIVLGVAMVKEAVEDYKRHKQDVEVNNRAVEVSAGAARAAAAAGLHRSCSVAGVDASNNQLGSNRSDSS